MKWGEIFPDPDMVGATEYLAIYDAIKDADLIGGIPFADKDPEDELSSEQLDHITAMLEEFKGHAQALLDKIKPPVETFENGEEHAIYSRLDWNTAVDDHETNLGYSDWVAQQIEVAGHDD